MERGAFLVLEGCDRVGKSTQVKRLVKALNDRGIKAESRGFPGLFFFFLYLSFSYQKKIYKN